MAEVAALNAYESRRRRPAFRRAPRRFTVAECERVVQMRQAGQTWLQIAVVFGIQEGRARTIYLTEVDRRQDAQLSAMSCHKADVPVEEHTAV